MVSTKNISRKKLNPLKNKITVTKFIVNTMRKDFLMNDAGTTFHNMEKNKIGSFPLKKNNQKLWIYLKINL